ncbi:borealin-like isoform X1 [Haliotis cracherodii]|uniref:borealin-like isoform X1 n=1 Tax=Haliotis cracherodii TaxID=6455 RepID=UPI0039EB0C59
MPPRKRTTRINKRAKPKAPEGDEGKSLTEQERERKLEVFLQDYDAKVETALKIMEDKINQLTKSVIVRLKGEIIQLPQKVREMTMDDFIASGGTVQCALEYLEMKSQEQDTGGFGRACPMSSQLVRTISQKRPNLLSETIMEEQGASPTPAQNRRKKATGRTTVKKSKHLQESSVYRPSAVMNSSLRSKYRTPSQRSMAASGWETPLITPKFDPKLPYTPAGVRDPRPGERLLSITGSPVSNPADPAVKLTGKVGSLAPTSADTAFRFTGKGLSFHINDIDDLENADIDIPEDHIKKVLSVFTSIMNKAKQ